MRKVNPYRERSLVNKHQETGIVTLNAGVGFPSSLDWSYSRSYMTDTVGFRDCMFNPCQHYKVKWQALKPLDFITSTDPSQVWACLFEGAYPRAAPLLHGIEVIRPPDPAFTNWLDDLNAKWQYEYTQAISDSASLLNFVIELVEMILEIPVKLAWFVARLVNAFESYWKYLAKHPGRFWLAWNFCIAPILRDIKDFLGVFEKVRKRLDFLRKHNRKPIVVHRRGKPREFSINTELSGIQSIAWPSTGDFQYNFPVDMVVELVGTLKVTPTGWAHVRFNIDDWLLKCDQFLAMQLGLADALWYLNPLKVLWEAAPFSWLADWFIRKSDQVWRDRIADLTPFKTAEVIQQGHSIKFEYLVTSVHLRMPGGNRYDLGSFETHVYLRAPGEISSGSDPWRVPESWYNLSILTSLLNRGDEFRR